MKKGKRIILERIIIILFESIGILGVLLVDELWKRGLYLLMVLGFFYLDCERYFKRKMEEKE